MNQDNKAPKVDLVYDVKKQAAKDGTAPIWVRITFDRNKRKYVSTGIKVAPYQWDAQYWVIKHTDAVRLNAMIRESLEKAHRGVNDWAHANTSSEINKQTIKVDRTESSFLDWMAERIDHENISEGTRKNHRSVFAQLQAYGKIRRFEDVTRKSVQAFIDWVRTRTVKKLVNGQVVSAPISQTRIYDYWKNLRKYVHIAQDEDLIPRGAVDGVTIARGENGEREHLTDEEIEIWRTTPMPSVRHADARDRFLVQMGTGVAYADLITTDFSKRRMLNGHLTLSGRRTKTREQFFLVILPIAQEVLEKWNWKVPSITNQDYNRYLLEVASICGIKKRITSHVGRHTYACQCLAHGVRIEAVQRTLGHSSIKTTQIYAKLVDPDVANAFDKTDFWDK